MPQEVKYNGKHFKSLTSLARHLKMNRLTVAKYFKKLKPGQDFQAVISEGFQNKNRLSKQFIYNGRRFKSIRELAKHLDIGEATLSTKFSSTRPGQDVTPIIVRILNNKVKQQGPWIYQGREFETRKLLERHLGVSPTTLRKWMKNIHPGGDCTQAIAAARSKNDSSIAFDGAKYQNMEVLSKKVGIPSATLHTWKRKGLSLKECVRIRAANRIIPEVVTNRSKLNWKELTIEDVVDASPWRHKLENIDFSKSYSSPEKRYKICGLICRIHGPLRGHRWLGGLKLGNQPCRSCCIKQRSTLRKSPWSMARIKKLMSNRDLPISLDVAKIGVVKTGKKERKEKVLINAFCTLHEKNISPIRIKHLTSGKAGCADCHAGHYSNDEMAEMISRTHGGTIQLKEYSGKLLDPSKFHCTICQHDWPSLAARILGNKSLRPSGCPRCKLNSYHEGVVTQFLIEQGLKFVRQAPWKIKGYKRPLRSDFYLPALAITIECDGIQHYMPVHRTSNPNRAIQEFRDIQKRDLDKRNFLERLGIRTSRIPYWVKDVRQEVSNILNGSPTFPNLPEIT